MITCLMMILSLKIPNKKQAGNIDKTRINTGFFSIIPNKNLSLGSIGTHGGCVNIRFGQRPNGFFIFAVAGCGAFKLQFVACTIEGIAAALQMRTLFFYAVKFQTVVFSEHVQNIGTNRVALCAWLASVFAAPAQNIVRR